jgi:hypothetical protein
MNLILLIRHPAYEHIPLSMASDIGICETNGEINQHKHTLETQFLVKIQRIYLILSTASNIYHV